MFPLLSLWKHKNCRKRGIYAIINPKGVWTQLDFYWIFQINMPHQGSRLRPKCTFAGIFWGCASTNLTWSHLCECMVCTAPKRLLHTAHTAEPRHIWTGVRFHWSREEMRFKRERFSRVWFNQSLFKTSHVTRQPSLKRLSGIQVQLLSLCMGKHKILQNCSLSLRFNFLFEITNAIG